MLEVIKHTFHVDNVKFVLVTNTTQLRAAINHSYGPLVDAQRYLDKFLKFSFCLPNFIPDNNSEKTLASVEHFDNLINESPVLKDTDLNQFNNGVHGFTTTLISHNQLSLRETETFVRYLEIFHTLSNGMAANIIFGHTLLRVLGVFIFCFRADIATAIRNNSVDAKQIAALLGLRSLEVFKDESNYPLHTEVIAALLIPACISDDDLYKPETEEQQKAILDYEHRYFNRQGLSQGDQFGSVLKSIEVLNLGGRL